MRKLILSTAITALTLMASVHHANAETNLRISWWGGNERHASTLLAIKAFEAKYPDIKVKAEYSGFSGHKTAKVTQITGGTEPDVMQINWNWLPDFTPKGTGFYDIASLKDVIDLSQFDPASLEAVTVNSKLNGVTIAVNGRIAFYNKTKWDEVGITEFPKTWDELKKAGLIFKEKTAGKGYPLFVGGQGQAGATLLRSYLVQKYGISMIDEQKKKWNVTEDQLTEMFTFYQELIDNHVMPTTKEYLSEGVGDEFESRNWMNGNYAGVYIWPTVVAKYSDMLNKGSDFVLGGQPMMADAKSSGIFYKPSMLYAIKKNTKYPKEAALLVNFLLNDPEAIKILGLTRGVPLSQIALTTLNDENQLNSLQAVGIDYVLKQNNSVKTSIYFDNERLYSLFQEVISDIDYGKLSIRDAAKKYYKKGNAILKRTIRN